MRKKAKYSLIIIVVLVVILGVGFGIYRDAILGRYAFYRGEKHFEVEEYEKATEYLKTSLRFNPDNPRTHLLLMKTYWARGLWKEMREEKDRIIALGEKAPPMPLLIKDLEEAYITRTASSVAEGWVIVFQTGDVRLGDIIDSSNIFGATFNSVANSPGAVRLYVEEAESTINIPAGYTIEITYDGGQALTVYLPPLTEEWNWLYVASDGSTYWDETLTQLAQATPSQPEEETKNE